MTASFAACRAPGGEIDAGITTEPTTKPAETDAPTETPALEPTASPTEAPTEEPTEAPTPVPMPTEGDRFEGNFSEIHVGIPMLVDLDGDGADDAVLITENRRNEPGFGWYRSHTVTIWLSSMPDSEPFALTKDPSYSVIAAAVDCDADDGRREIIMGCDYESEDYNMVVLRVNDEGTGVFTFEAGMGFGDMSWYQGIPEDYVFDPAVGLPCSARTEILGAFYVYGRFTVTGEGIVTSAVYEYPDMHNENYVGRVTLVRDITLELVDAELNGTGGSVTVHAGAILYQRYTDLKSWVVVELEDGRLARAEVSFGEYDVFPVFINGILRDELGEIAYAD